MNPRVPMAAAGLFGAAGVIFGAFGAHVLHAALAANGMFQVWETAVRYQLIHAVALAAVAGWIVDRTADRTVDRTAVPTEARTVDALSRARFSSRSANAAAWSIRLWIAGIFLFSGSLYALALGGSRVWGPVTPLGGLCLLAGWLCLLVSALSGKTHEP